MKFCGKGSAHWGRIFSAASSWIALATYRCAFWDDRLGAIIPLSLSQPSFCIQADTSFKSRETGASYKFCAQRDKWPAISLSLLDCLTLRSATCVPFITSLFDSCFQTVRGQLLPELACGPKASSRTSRREHMDDVDSHLVSVWHLLPREAEGPAKRNDTRVCT